MKSKAARDEERRQAYEHNFGHLDLDPEDRLPECLDDDCAECPARKECPGAK